MRNVRRTPHDRGRDHGDGDGDQDRAAHRAHRAAV